LNVFAMRHWPLVLLVVTSAVWGSSYVVAKVALEEISPPLLAALRFGIAALVLAALSRVSKRKTQRKPMPWRDAAKLAGLGVFGVGLNGLFDLWGISLTTASDAALLIVGEVLFTTLLAMLLAGEQLNSARRLALVSGIVGVVVLIVGGASGNDALAPARPLGDVLILVGLAFESLYTVLGTRLTQRYDPLTVLSVSMGGSCVIWVPVIVWYLASRQAHVPSGLAIAGVLYLALVNSVACYLVWFGVLRRSGATLGAVSLLAQPVVGATLGIVLLGDRITLSTLLGGACVLVCLVLAAIGSQSRARTAAPSLVGK
jgi:drug/metabolite transporter (DMT)-like permease